MSYDFRLFKRKAGEESYETARADSEEISSLPPDPQKETLKRRVADALIARNPQLEIFKFDYDAIAKSQKITVEEARLRFRHLELNGSQENTNGIQIMLFDDEASVTVPFWHDGDRAAESFREIWTYLKIITQESGYLIYDPQTDRVFDASEGFDAALSCYTGVVSQIKQKLPKPQAVKKPWWRIW